MPAEQNTRAEYELSSVNDLGACGKVSFTITLKNLNLQEYSSLDFQVNLSDEGCVYWSLRLTACNIAKSTDTC